MPGSRKYADLSKNVRHGGLDDIDTGDSKCHHGSPARKRGRSSNEHSSGWRLFYRSVCSAGGSCRRMLKRSRTHVGARSPDGRHVGRTPVGPSSLRCLFSLAANNLPMLIVLSFATILR